jgi:flagellar biosynthesis/type III secretory pathway protein FliH
MHLDTDNILIFSSEDIKNYLLAEDIDCSFLTIRERIAEALNYGLRRGYEQGKEDGYDEAYSDGYDEAKKDYNVSKE